MLRALSIRDFVIVERLELEPEAGFTVLTGETGAGKSILVDAIALVVGERADSSVVRAGAARAEIAAEFSIEGLPELAAWLEARDLGEGESLLLRRVIDRQGRSRAYVNGTPSPVQALREIGEHLLDIHGQHAHQSLLRPAAQRELLDAYGGFGVLGQAVGTAWRAWREAVQRRESAAQGAAALEAERARREAAVDDLSRLAPGETEWGELEVEHRRLANAAALIQTAQGCLAGLSEGDEALDRRLAALAHRLAGFADVDPALGETLELLRGAEANLKEAIQALRAYASRLDLDPERLRQVEERMAALHAAARRHRVRPVELPAALARMARELAELDSGADAAELERREAGALEEYRRLARDLTAKRGHAAHELETAVTANLQALAMEGGRFGVELHPLEEPASFGAEQVEFVVAPHPGQPSGPLARVASGGELSRVSLAIQVATSEVARVPTLIFDEVDAGIGGAVADVVGLLLAELGRRRQVLCVTHLPQVAACARAHLRVTKRAARGGVASTLERLAPAERLEEIARMLGGATVTAATRAHAREMLESGAAPAATRGASRRRA